MRYVINGLLGLCAASELMTGKQIHDNLQIANDKLQTSHPVNKDVHRQPHTKEVANEANSLDASIL